MLRTALLLGSLWALVATVGLQGGPGVARAQDSAAPACQPGDLEVSAYERAGGPGPAGVDGQVTLDVSVVVAQRCAITHIESVLLDVGGQPVAGVEEARVELDQAVQPSGPHLVGTVIWHNWCNDPALGPYGAEVRVNGVPLLVPRLALTPLCFDAERPVLLDIEITPSTGRRVVPGLISFGQRLAGLASTRDHQAVAGLFEVREFTCPGDPDYVFSVCEGEPAGSTVTGYAIGRLNSEGNVVPRETFIEVLSDALDRLSSNDVRLFTVSETGFGDCPECVIAVLSTPMDAAAADGTAEILVFQLRASGGQYRIFLFLDGFVSRPGEFAIVNGGSYSGLTYVRIEPGGPAPPLVGTGVRAARGSSAISGRGLVVVGLLLLATSAAVLLPVRRR